MCVAWQKDGFRGCKANVTRRNIFVHMNKNTRAELFKENKMPLRARSRSSTSKRVPKRGKKRVTKRKKPVKFRAGGDYFDDKVSTAAKTGTATQPSYWRRLSNYAGSAASRTQKAYRRIRSPARKASDRAKNAYRRSRSLARRASDRAKNAYRRSRSLTRKASGKVENAYRRSRSLARKTVDKANTGAKYVRRKYAKTKKYGKKYGRKAAGVGSRALDMLARESRRASDALARAGKSKSRDRN
jgi:hypothetical protein